MKNTHFGTSVLHLSISHGHFLRTKKNGKALCSYVLMPKIFSHTELKVAVRTCEGKATHRMTQIFAPPPVYFKSTDYTDFTDFLPAQQTVSV